MKEGPCAQRERIYHAAQEMMVHITLTFFQPFPNALTIIELSKSNDTAHDIWANKQLSSLSLLVAACIPVDHSVHTVCAKLIA